MPVAKEQIRQIIADNNLNSVADVYTLLRDGFKDILQELMEATLDLGLGEHGPDCFLEAVQAVYAEEQHVLHATVLQVVQHPHPELGTLICPYRDAENLLVPFRCDPKHHIGRPAEYPPVFPDLVVDAVHEHERVDWVQGTVLAFPDLCGPFL